MEESTQHTFVSETQPFEFDEALDKTDVHPGGSKDDCAGIAVHSSPDFITDCETQGFDIFGSSNVEVDEADDTQSNEAADSNGTVGSALGGATQEFTPGAAQSYSQHDEIEKPLSVNETQEFDMSEHVWSPGQAGLPEREEVANATLGFDYTSTGADFSQSSLYDDTDDIEGDETVDDDDRILTETQAFEPQIGENDEIDNDNDVANHEFDESTNAGNSRLSDLEDSGMMSHNVGQTQRFDIDHSASAIMMMASAEGGDRNGTIGRTISEEDSARAQHAAAAAATARVVVEGYSDDEDEEDAVGKDVDGPDGLEDMVSFATQRFEMHDGSSDDEDQNGILQFGDGDQGGQATAIGVGEAGDLNLDVADFSIPDNLDTSSVPLSPEELLESLKELEGEQYEQDDKAAYDNDAEVTDVDQPPEPQPNVFVDPSQLLDDVDSDDDEDDDDEGPRGPGKNIKRIVGVLGDGEDELYEDGADRLDEGADEAKELIADIFGESDEEDARSGDGIQHGEDGEGGDFEGFGADDDDRPAEGVQQPGDAGSDDDDDELRKRERAPDFEYDFDVMLRKKKEENRKRYRKRRGGVDFINDADDQISNLMQRMKLFAHQDREMNEQRLPALHKRKLLHIVVSTLKKADLQMQLIESGIMSCVAEWLSPLPDKSLPSLEVRTELLKILTDYPPLEPDTLKSSQIGKAVMFLYKHPKETRENKKRASKLISEWARPIFNINTDFRSVSKEDREQRDYEHMSAKKRRKSKETMTGEDEPKANKEEPPEKVLRPGDKGWIGRARVPRPSTKDYVVRPKWNVDGEFKLSKRSVSRLDVKLREFNNRTKPSTAKKGTNMSINGSRMQL